MTRVRSQCVTSGLAVALALLAGCKQAKECRPGTAFISLQCPVGVAVDHFNVDAHDLSTGKGGALAPIAARCPETGLEVEIPAYTSGHDLRIVVRAMNASDVEVGRAEETSMLRPGCTAIEVQTIAAMADGSSGDVDRDGGQDQGSGDGSLPDDRVTGVDARVDQSSGVDANPGMDASPGVDARPDIILAVDAGADGAVDAQVTDGPSTIDAAVDRMGPTDAGAAMDSSPDAMSGPDVRPENDARLDTPMDVAPDVPRVTDGPLESICGLVGTQCVDNKVLETCTVEGYLVTAACYYGCSTVRVMCNACITTSGSFCSGPLTLQRCRADQSGNETISCPRGCRSEPAPAVCL